MYLVKSIISNNTSALGFDFCFICLKVVHYLLQFIQSAASTAYLLGSWLGSPYKWWWMHCFGLPWQQGQEEDTDAVLCQMTNILDKRRLAVVPDELGIRLSLQTGSKTFVFEISEQMDFLCKCTFVQLRHMYHIIQNLYVLEHPIKLICW